jgi:hypothetical protein
MTAPANLPAASQVKKGHAAIWLSVTFILILLIATAPLISASIGGGVASALGCEVTEGVSSPCMFMGRDISETLSVMFVLGWLAFDTLPFGAFLLAIWAVVACVVAFFRWRRRHSAA